MSRGAAAACTVINIATHHAAYFIALVLAVAITVVLRETSWILVFVAVAFIACATAMTVGIALRAGRRVESGTIIQTTLFDKRAYDTGLREATRVVIDEFTLTYPGIKAEAWAHMVIGYDLFSSPISIRE